MDFTAIMGKVECLFNGTQEKRPVEEMCNLKHEIITLLERAREEQDENQKKTETLQEKICDLQNDLKRAKFASAADALKIQEQKFALYAASQYIEGLKQDLEVYMRTVESIMLDDENGIRPSTPELTGLTEPEDLE